MAHTSTDSPTTPEGTQHVHDVLESFDILMLATFETDGTSAAPTVRARPMAVAELDEDCTLSFITRDTSAKVNEALDAPVGHVFGQSKTRYISLRGHLIVDQDRQRLKELWKPAYNVWFDGPDDPEAVLVSFIPDEAELWDSAGTKGLKFLFESAKALVTGTKPDHDDPQQHARVKL